MLKPFRFIAAIVLAFLALTLVPAGTATAVRDSSLAVLEGPLSLSQKIAGLLKEMTQFHSNADALQRLRSERAALVRERFQYAEMAAENQRLTELLDVRGTFPLSEKMICARVIGRSFSTSERMLLIDKGSQDGLRRGMPVLSEASLIGKVTELRARAAKVLLISDINCRVGAMVVRTRDQGILHGAAGGLCRLKYLPTETQFNKGDLVETAGFGRLFPKGIVIGRIVGCRKQPGQVYQAAEVRPVAALSRVEEVICLNAL